MSATPTPRSARHGVTRRQVITTGALTIAALAALAAPASPVVRLSGVMKADAMAQMPNELVVQAWRVLSWPRGVHSIARFELLA